MRIHDKDFCQRVLTLDKESITLDPDLITLRSACHAQVVIT